MSVYDQLPVPTIAFDEAYGPVRRPIGQRARDIILGSYDPVTDLALLTVTLEEMIRAKDEALHSTLRALRDVDTARDRLRDENVRLRGEIRDLRREAA